MDPLHAFADERLNADLAAILRWRDDRETRPDTGRRVGLARMLGSPAASATLGVSFFLAMLGTTAYLMYTPRSPTTIEAPRSPAMIAHETAPAPSVAEVAAPEAPPEAARIVTPRPQTPAVYASRPAKRGKSRSSSPSSRAIAPFEADTLVMPPVVLEARRKSDGERVTDLAQAVAPTLPPVRADAVIAPAAIEDEGATLQAAQTRRDSVAAIRALRRQW
ncbi:MAG: hypothetical protein PGN12_01950 [Sphingomonas phyllosphaerae]